MAGYCTYIRAPRPGELLPGFKSQRSRTGLYIALQPSQGEPVEFKDRGGSLEGLAAACEHAEHSGDAIVVSTCKVLPSQVVFFAGLKQRGIRVVALDLGNADVVDMVLEYDRHQAPAPIPR